MKYFVLVMPVVMLITACSSSNSGSSPSYKRNGGQRPNLNLFLFDTNKDNRVSRAEFLNATLPNGRKPQDRMFNRIDSNNDGYITQSEFDNMKSRRGRSKRNY